MSITQRFFLNNATAGYTPATIRGSWDATASAVTKALGRLPLVTGGTTIGIAETNTTNLWDVLLARFVSDPFELDYSFTTSDTVQWLIGALESNASANDFFHVHIYVTTGDSDTPRGTILTNNIGATEWTTTATARTEGAKTLSALACSVGDRLVVEIGYQAQNTVATSFTGTINYGDGGGSASIFSAGSTGTDLTGATSWIEFTLSDHLFRKSAAAWDPNNKDSDTVLSDSNLLATATFSIEKVGTVRSILGRTKGRYVVAFKTKSFDNHAPYFGFCESAFTLTDNVCGLVAPAAPSVNNFAFTCAASDYGLYAGGSQTATNHHDAGPGETFFIAFDLDKRCFYAKRNNTLWVGFGGELTGGTTPDTDTTRAAAYDFSGVIVANGLWFPAMGYDTDGTGGTGCSAEIDPSAFGHGLTTFLPWDHPDGRIILPTQAIKRAAFF